MRDISHSNSVFKDYYRLAKPGIIYGNAITFAGGFFFASRGNIDYTLLWAGLLGIALIIASSCVLNNYIDRDIDTMMERTKGRALASGTIPLQHAIVFATCLMLFGILFLYFFTNIPTLAIALFGAFFYVVVYSLWTKRQSVYGTLVGSISGAAPPVIGYVAVTNNFDLSALLLFVILALWQMPHFYAIAIYRRNDYKEAKVPVLPLIKGIRTTKIHMLCYIIFFAIATVLLAVFGYANHFYLLIMSTLSLAWLLFSIKGFRFTSEADDNMWAKRMFFFSILVITIFSLTIAVGYV